MEGLGTSLAEPASALQDAHLPPSPDGLLPQCHSQGQDSALGWGDHGAADLAKSPVATSGPPGTRVHLP